MKRVIGSPTLRLESARARVRVGLGLCVAVAAAATAAPPNVPLPRPFYTFDHASPTVTAGFVGAADILQYGDPYPLVAVPGAVLGLPAAADDLDALSAANAGVTALDEFVLLFSVDRPSLGSEPPLPLLVEQHVPYNALDQAERGHAAGDQFMSLLRFNLAGPVPGRGGATNNSLVRNNYDEGGTSFSAQPPAHSRDDLSGYPLRVPQDNVDGFGDAAPIADGPGGPWVYYSASRNSPSLAFLSTPFEESGAHVFRLPLGLDGGNPDFYASCFELGLVPLDDIDGLIVFDRDQSRHFDNQDVVLFSLAPGSPSLALAPAGSGSPTACIFVVRPGPLVDVFAPAFDLGVGAPGDNIDALDYAFCANGIDCALSYGILFFAGDWDDDGDVDIVDFEELGFALLGPDTGPLPPTYQYFDLDDDDDADLRDFDRFQRAFTGPRQP